eukprot:g12266.t1
MIAHHDFYGRYDGHPPRDLRLLVKSLRDRGRRSSQTAQTEEAADTSNASRDLIFLAGDSSLDNKFWLGGRAPAVNGYENVLYPPLMKQDVCYWINHLLDAEQDKESPDAVNSCSRTACVNCAVEASSLSSRSTLCGGLHEQDLVIREAAAHRDTVVVSIGGNDIALVPSLCTAANLLLLAWCVPSWCLGDAMESSGGGCTATTYKGRGCVCGFYPGVVPPNIAPDLGCCCGCHVLNCLQSGLPGVCGDCCEEMVPLALFEALNGKDSREYIARVEPSERGGRKIAEAILRAAKMLGGGDGDGNGTTSTQEQLQGGVAGSAVVPGAPVQASM